MRVAILTLSTNPSGVVELVDALSRSGHTADVLWCDPFDTTVIAWLWHTRSMLHAASV